MKCDLCDQEATVHEQTIRAGKVSERHLCERCAREAGISINPAAPLTSLLSQFMTTGKPPAPGQAAGPVAAAACPSCGLTYAKFKESGLLGCPDCYAAFEPSLGPLLERAHEGGAHHAGKKPRRLMQQVAAHRQQAGAPAPAGPPAEAAAASAPASAPARAPAGRGESASPQAMPVAERQRRIVALRKLLAVAIGDEQYERAAQIRDELRRLGDPDVPPAEPGRAGRGPAA